MEKITPFSGCQHTVPVALGSISQSMHFILQIGMTCIPSSSNCGGAIIGKSSSVAKSYGDHGLFPGLCNVFSLRFFNRKSAARLLGVAGSPSPVACGQSRARRVRRGPSAGGWLAGVTGQRLAWSGRGRTDLGGAVWAKAFALTVPGQPVFDDLRRCNGTERP